MKRANLWLAIILLGGVCLLSTFGPMLVDANPYDQNLGKTLQAPCPEQWLGSDHLGRSILSRLVSGGRYSLSIACLTVTISCTIGSLLGIVAGYWGKNVDILIMRMADLAMSFPGTLLAIILAGLLGGSLFTLVAALSANLWCDYCRVARNITLTLRNSTDMQAGLMLGFSGRYLMRVYIAPFVVPQLGTLASLGMGRTILNVSGLGFLGIGLSPPLPEWGGMINEGISCLNEAPWFVMAPGAMICATVLGFQLLAGNLSVEK